MNCRIFLGEKLRENWRKSREKLEKSDENREKIRWKNTEK
jgi:hypothetical protein